MKWLDGQKTNIGMIAYGLLGIAVAQGWVSNEWALTIGAAITTWTGVTVREAWKKKGAAKAEPKP